MAAGRKSKVSPGRGDRRTGKPVPPDAPTVAHLTHRLSRCPREFLRAPRIGDGGAIHVAAVVWDLLSAMAGGPADPALVREFETDDPDEAGRFTLILVASWLLHDPWFCGKGGFVEPAAALLREGLRPLGGLVPAERFVLEPDRREELARRCLDGLGLIPPGETPEAAADRLASLDSVERHRVMEEARKAEEHAKKVREALAKKKAREAAAKVMRE